MKLWAALLLAVIAQAQTTHSVTLAWTDSLNPSGTTYSVYRAPTACSNSPVFAKVAINLTIKSYLDSNIAPGSYCYQVSATFSGVESGPSNNSTAAVGAFSPTNLTVTIQ